jgi:TRAP-type C4-dicarboxylate transport system permease small subunit
VKQLQQNGLQKQVKLALASWRNSKSRIDVACSLPSKIMSTSVVQSNVENQIISWWMRPLDKTYLWAGYAAAACICLILFVTITQISSRYLGINFRGLSSYAGYLMAASTYLGLAHALSRGSHIRIETISKLFGSARIYIDLFAFATGLVISLWFAWYSCNMVYTTYVLQDVSTDLDATPLWIPQLAMAIGSVLFAVAMADNFLTLLLTRQYRFQPSVQTV